MSINCPNCNATNGDEAKFCDQCGAALGQAAAPAPAPAPAAAPAAGVNWWPIFGIVVVIAVLVWLFAGPKNNAQAPGASGSNSNPHASGTTANGDNPHAMGGQAGMPDIDGMKAKLDANPLDVASLRDLYQTYGMINLGAKCRPYLDKAMAALLDQRATLGDSWTATGRQIAVAALMGGDSDGALAALNQLQVEEPNDMDTVLLLADVHYSLSQPDDAVNFYTQYLDAETPEIAGDTYWQAHVRRAQMRLKQYEQSPDELRDTAALDAALKELKGVIDSQPRDFNAWLALGNVYETQGEDQQAEDAYKKCSQFATGAQEDWQARAALAELHGEEPPPKPAPSGMGGMANPHGGMGGGNPHGGMGGASSDDSPSNT